MDADLEAFLASLPTPASPLRRAPGNTTRKVAEDFISRLADRRRSRLALADDRLDGQRFRYWFTHCVGDEISLDDWRKLIDQKIINGKTK